MFFLIRFFNVAWVLGCLTPSPTALPLLSFSILLCYSSFPALCNVLYEVVHLYRDMSAMLQSRTQRKNLVVQNK